MSIDYQRLWSVRTSIDSFGDALLDAWGADYVSADGADSADLVMVDPGNGFTYLFDLAGLLSGVARPQGPRVVGVWGLS